MNRSFFDPAPSPEGLWFPERATPEQRLLYDSIKQFTESAMAPHEAALEAHDYGIARSLFRQCGELGVFSAELDEADGGQGFGVVDSTILCEALGRGHSLNVGLMVHQGVGMQPIACFGTKGQRAKYLPGAAAGACIMAFALTEQHCGSDALALKMSAILDGHSFVLSGAKQFITNAAYADCFVTFARIPDVGITAFLVDAGTPGLSIGTEEKKLGQHASSTCSVFYDNVRVDASKLLGVAGEGHRIALNMLNLGRLKLSAACVGKMKVLLPQAVAYAKERKAFGQPIAEFGMIRERIARMTSLLYVSESAVYRVASEMENALAAARGDRASLPATERLAVLQDFALECALVKAFVTESLGTFTDDMLQIYGGYGFSEEYPAAKAFRDARVTRLYEGTTEICRLTALRRLYPMAQKLELFSTPQMNLDRLSMTPMAKYAVGLQLKRRLEIYGNDIEFVHKRQEMTSEFGAAFEQIYAAESASIRCDAEAMEMKPEPSKQRRHIKSPPGRNFGEFLLRHFESYAWYLLDLPDFGGLDENLESDEIETQSTPSRNLFGVKSRGVDLVAHRVIASGGKLPGYSSGESRYPDRNS